MLFRATGRWLFTLMIFLSKEIWVDCPMIVLFRKSFRLKLEKLNFESILWWNRFWFSVNLTTIWMQCKNSQQIYLRIDLKYSVLTLKGSHSSPYWPTIVLKAHYKLISKAFNNKSIFSNYFEKYIKHNSLSTYLWIC